MNVIRYCCNSRFAADFVCDLHLAVLSIGTYHFPHITVYNNDGGGGGISRKRISTRSDPRGPRETLNTSVDGSKMVVIE